ncbi:hypothetical protein GCM10027614_07670 [Micromonospora vulcania]
MFERFTDRARRSVVLAQEEARSHRHDYIGTEHLLLGLISEGAGVAAQVLQTQVSALDELRRRVDHIIGSGHTEPGGHILFTPATKFSLELALRNALQLGHSHIGTEHLLLGLISEGDGVAAQVLYWSGITLDAVRDQAVRILAGIDEVQPA